MHDKTELRFRTNGHEWGFLRLNGLLRFVSPVLDDIDMRNAMNQTETYIEFGHWEKVSDVVDNYGLLFQEQKK